jgi:ferritin
MQMSDKLEAAFNEQISAEFASSYTYLQMAAYCDLNHLLGSGQWLRAQAEEERVHAMKFYEYVLHRGNEVKLSPIAAPEPTWNSLAGVFAAALDQELRVTQRIQSLYRRATEEQDFACYSLLQWFVNEQVEEESTIERIAAQAKMIGDNNAALLIFDQELGSRTAVTQSPL